MTSNPNLGNNDDNGDDSEKNKGAPLRKSLSPKLNLSNHFLIAMPGGDDPWFGQSVVYLCEHSERGALGLVINKPTHLSVAELFTRVDLKLSRDDLRESLVVQGGPLRPEHGFVLHERMQAQSRSKSKKNSILATIPTYNSTIFVGNALELTSSKDILEVIANGAGPKQVEIFLGHAAWGPLQLESEIANNAWLSVTADVNLIFNTPIAARYQAALALLGIAEWALTRQAGHA